MKHKLLLLLMALSITGCSLQELRHEDRPAASRAFGMIPGTVEISMKGSMLKKRLDEER